MADSGFFQPGPSKGSSTTSTTLSPAQQAVQKMRLEMLGRLLNSSAGNGPTFKSFVQGGPASRPFPSGMGDSTAGVLQAMMQPGAFTTTSTGSSEMQGPSPSMLSDLTQLGLLGALVYKSGVLGDILSGVGGAKGIGGVNAALGDHTPDDLGNQGSVSSGTPSLDSLIGSQYGSGTSMIPGGDASLVPANYPGLDDGGMWQTLLSYL